MPLDIPRLVVADDATGALEAGALLAGAGLDARVLLSPGRMEETAGEALVALWPGRHMAPEAVADDLRAWWGRLSPPELAAIYWKTDSTLRGPLGACFQTLLGLLTGRVLVFCPAYPAMGRTVRDGVLLVDGVPLEQTVFARCSRVMDALRPECEGLMRAARSTQELRALLEQGGGGVIVCDAETEAEVEACHRVCREWGGPLLAAGPAGGVRYWCERGGIAKAGEWPQVERWRVLCGSRHPVSRAQSVAARVLGLDVAMTPEENGAPGTKEAEVIAMRALEGVPDGFIVFGGDTTLALCRHLGVTCLQPLGELLPGVAVSLAGRHALVTKAGGFGGANVVARILSEWKTR